MPDYGLIAYLVLGLCLALGRIYLFEAVFRLRASGAIREFEYRTDNAVLKFLAFLVFTRISIGVIRDSSFAQFIVSGRPPIMRAIEGNLFLYLLGYTLAWPLYMLGGLPDFMIGIVQYCGHLMRPLNDKLRKLIGVPY